MMHRKSSEERWAARKAAKTKRTEERVRNRKIAVGRAKGLMIKLASMIADSGYSRLKISTYSGACQATVTKIARRYKSTSVPFYTVVGICRALGYKVTFERLPPEQDEFLNDRWIRATELLKKKDEESG